MPWLGTVGCLQNNNERQQAIASALHGGEPAAARDRFTLAVQCENGALLFCWGQLQNPQTQVAADTVKAEELIN